MCQMTKCVIMCCRSSQQRRVRMCVSVRVWYSRDTEEGCIAAVQEGAVDHLQDEGEVLKRQVRRGGTNREQHTLQRREEER